MQQPQVSNGNPFNPFNNVDETPQKPNLTKVDSFVSYTEPGPITNAEVVSTDNFMMMGKSPSGTTNEFMAILERNSAILQQASEKNEEMNALAMKNVDNKQEQIETNGDNDHDNVDAAIAKEEPSEEPDKAENEEQNEDKDKSKFWNSHEINIDFYVPQVLDEKKDEVPAAKKGIFARWGSNNKSKTSSVTPPNSPVPEESEPVQGK